MSNRERGSGICNSRLFRRQHELAGALGNEDRRLNNVKDLVRFFRVSTNGIGIHVAEAGPPDGPLVFLLHGFPEFWYGSGFSYSPQAPRGRERSNAATPFQAICTPMQRRMKEESLSITFITVCPRISAILWANR